MGEIKFILIEFDATLKKARIPEKNSNLFKI